MGQAQNPNRRWTAVSASFTSGVSGTSSVQVGLAAAITVAVVGKYTSTTGGSAVNVYHQVSFNSGADWTDIVQFNWSGAESGIKAVNLLASSITTAVAGTSGTRSANTVLEGLIGDQHRTYHTTTGSATAGVLTVFCLTKGSR